MDKSLTRISVVLIAAYFIISYVLAQFFGIDIMRSTYVILLETCVVAYTFCSGKYHCRFMRWTALSILICDIVSHADYYLDILSVDAYNLIPISVMAIGITTSSVLAIRHFYMISKLRRIRDEHRRTISS